MRWCLAALLLAGCGRCGGVGAVDAGPVDAGARVARGLGLHTAFVHLYPEFRGTAVESAGATLTRKMEGLTEANRDAELQKLRWSAADGGWQLYGFTLVQRAPDVLEVQLAIDADQLGQIYLTPAGVSSQQLGMYLPRALPVVEERFVVEVRYATSPELAAKLVEQASTLLLGTGQWKLVRGVDWDAGVPETFEVALADEANGGRVTWRRVRGRVQATYELETWARR